MRYAATVALTEEAFADMTISRKPRDAA